MSCFGTIFGAFIRFYSDGSVSLCEKKNNLCTPARNASQRETGGSV